MIKKFYALCLLCLLALSGRAQYFALAYDSVSPYVTALPYPMDSYYRVLSYDHSFPNPQLNRANIKVYDSIQQYVKTINMLRGITLLNDYPPLLYNKRLLWPANYHDTVGRGYSALVILELDTAYAFVAMHTISTHSAMALPTGIVGYSTGFVVGEYFNGPQVSSTGYSTKVYKLNLNLQKTDSTLLLDELRLKTHTSHNNLIVGASDNLSSACTNTNPTTQQIVLDTNLSVASCFNLNAYSINFCYDGAGNVVNRFAVRYNRKGIIFPLSNYRHYFHCTTDSYICPPINGYNIILSGAFSGNGLFSGNYLNDNYPANTEFSLYQSANCDYNNGHTIYVGTVGLPTNYAVDKNFYLPYYARPKTKIVVTKLDTLGAQVWSQQYGGEMNYFARSVAFTKDGGCVVAGSRYDSASVYTGQLFENFLLKLDAAGNAVYVGIKENDLAMSTIKCFPNPGNSSIYFDLPFNDNSTLQIYNGMGQLVLENKNYSSRANVDIQPFSTGVYVYKIVSSKRVYTGKLIKE